MYIDETGNYYVIYIIRELKEQCPDVLTVMCFFEGRLKEELCVIFTRLKFMTGESKLIDVKA